MQGGTALADNAAMMDLYSRQIGAFGLETMQKLVQLRILIVGVGGVGIEVAKNIVLAGPGVVTLVDSKQCTAADLGTNFYLLPSDVEAGSTRVEACVERVRDLNRHVDVRAVTDPLSETIVAAHDVAIFCDRPHAELLRWNAFCRAQTSHKISFIAAAARGVASYIFSDFGDEFIVSNEKGETAITRVVTNITSDADGLLSIVSPDVHVGAEKLSGDGAIDFDSEHSGWVTIEDVRGMAHASASASSASVSNAGASPATINEVGPRRVRQCMRLVPDRKHRRSDPADLHRGQFYIHVRVSSDSAEYVKDSDRPDGLRWKTVWDDEVASIASEDFVTGHVAEIDAKTKNVKYVADPSLDAVRLQLMKVVVDPYSCYIGDTSTFGPYEGGGQVVQHFEPTRHKHRSLAATLAQPLPDEASPNGAVLLAADELKVSKKWYETLHLAQLALFEFEAQNGRLPAPNVESDAEAVVVLACEINGKMLDCVPPKYSDPRCAAATLDLRVAAARFDGDVAELPAEGAYKPTATYTDAQRAMIEAAADGCATPYHAAFALQATGWTSADDAVMWQYMDGCEGSDGAAKRDAYVAGAYASEALVHLKDIARVASCSLQPLCAFIGGAVAQEAIKHTGRFTPIEQWFHFDCVDVLPESLPLPPVEVDIATLAAADTRYTDLVQMVGKSVLTKLQCARTFMVGCGALGCEFLKNFAMIGLACDAAGRGRITVTDGDRIEVSNLNRQFLFREKHVGTPKSTTARDVVCEMNTAMRVDALELLAMPKTEDTFGSAFWAESGILASSSSCSSSSSSSDAVSDGVASSASSSCGLTFVTNALDSVKARKYVDSRCVFFNKPLFESGTEGTQFNTMVVLPNRTDSYDDGTVHEVPAAEDVHGSCTLKNFPFLLVHCVQFARQLLFDEPFVGNVQTFQQYARAPWAHDASFAAQEALAVAKDTACALRVIKQAQFVRAHGFDGCVQLAVDLFQLHFCRHIRTLQEQHPEDKKLDDGRLFWSPPKRFPTAVELDLTEDGVVFDFVRSAANLYAVSFGIQPLPMDGVVSASAPAPAGADIDAVGRWNTFVPAAHEWRSRTAIAAAAELGSRGQLLLPLALESDPEDLAQLRAELIKTCTSEELSAISEKMQPAEFEKDLDLNFHMDFITAAANLRAVNYGIKTGTRHKCKMIAGAIIPAIATSTACATALICIEMVKLVQEKPTAAFYNSSCNFAVNAFKFSLPSKLPRTLPANDAAAKEASGEATSRTWPAEGFTKWDQTLIAGDREMTLGGCVAAIEARTSLVVASISLSNSTFGMAQKFLSKEKLGALDAAATIALLLGETESNPLSRSLKKVKGDAAQLTSRGLVGADLVAIAAGNKRSAMKALKAKGFHQMDGPGVLSLVTRMTGADPRELRMLSCFEAEGEQGDGYYRIKDVTLQDPAHPLTEYSTPAFTFRLQS